MSSTQKIQSLHHIHSGKVRDSYKIEEGRMLMVASDRLSAFDVVLPDEIPGKGEALTQMSLFWFRHTKGIVPNHLVPDANLAEILCDPSELAWAENRSMIV